MTRAILSSDTEYSKACQEARRLADHGCGYEDIMAKCPGWFTEELAREIVSDAAKRRKEAKR